MSNNIELHSLLRLQTWLSPVFPLGSYAYSHGLERAVHDDIVINEQSLAAWLKELLTHGSPWNDAVLLAESWRQVEKGGSPDALIELGEAMSISCERHLETMAQGQAFLEAVDHWSLPNSFQKPQEAPLPVAVGTICGVMKVPLVPSLGAYLQAFCNNQLQAAIRLSVLGQKGAARLMAALEPTLIECAEKASKSTLDDLGGISIHADIMAMNHEIQTTRLFRS